MNNSKLSKRIQKIKPSASMKANEKALSLLQKGEKIINLSIGEPDFDTPEGIKSEAVRAIENNCTHYTDSKGIYQLRESISEKLLRENSIEAHPDKNIIVTPGVKQALYYLNCCLIDDGEEGIIFEPYWLTYADSIKLCSGKPVFVKGDVNSGFKPDLDDIRKKITSKTKYILFSNPCNPTGALWSKDDLKDIVEIAVENDIFLIVDEIYEKIVFDEIKFVSCASLEGAKDVTITLNGFSKAVAMTGWRLGYAAGPKTVIEAMKKMQQQTATCPCSVSQMAALAASSEQDACSRMRDEYAARRDILFYGLANIKGFQPFQPKGTFYIFTDISGLDMGSIEAAEHILEEAKVMCVPGEAYGESCRQYLRFSFAANTKEIKEAINRLSDAFGIKSETRGGIL